jgi:hypothetical protein
MKLDSPSGPGINFRGSQPGIRNNFPDAGATSANTRAKNTLALAEIRQKIGRKFKS